MNRKLKKLIKSPRLYFVDMFKKKLAKGSIPKKFIPKLKTQGNYKYSIVSAVYGVEKYLEQFLTSLENQTLSFKDHIELIMVDDGSLDNSANIIKKWVNKYPDNIKSIKKENGGQASARNLGIKHVTNDWVTFMDPDDFVDIHYLAEVDKFISKEKNIALVSCNFIFYLEDKDLFSDTHPLKHRFEKNETVLDVDNLKDHIQLNVNSAFFKLSLIMNHGLIMEPDIKPTFEDGHFIGKYLLSVNKMKVGFIRNAKYYYRKREDSTSSIDKSWKSTDQYTTKLKNGYLDLLQYALTTKGYVPENIQRTVLYDIIWYIKHIVNHEERISFLKAEDKKLSIKLLKEIFSYIDINIINDFYLAGCWFYHKVGLIGALKGEDKLPIQIVYLENFDSEKKLVQFKYYYHGSLPLEFFDLDGDDIIPVYSKTRVHDFFGEVFVNERIIWLPMGNQHKKFSAKINNTSARISIKGKQYHNGISAEHIFDNFKKIPLQINKFPISIRKLRNQAKSHAAVNLYLDAWLFMDRDTQADDNAEHLYRYVKKNHPEVNAFFVLRKTSHDWQRLEKEGFRLLNFNTQKHKLALLNADHVISSHADQYVVSLLDEKYFSDLIVYRYTFLQHGITKDDLSNWLNNKPIDLFVTATTQEYNSIVGDNNRYKYTEKEVSLTGFPRHDALLTLNNNVESEKLIVIMPTWREGIVGTAVGKGNSREINDKFHSSEYAKCWKSVLHSKELKELCFSNSYKIVFFPHANIEPYIDWFKVPDYIDTLSHEKIDSIQHLFCQAALMITDYSSVAFEMAYLRKFIIYYQFDYDYVFGGGHLTSKGYFDYERDGFGPVCRTEQSLLSALSNFLEDKDKFGNAYLDRIDKTFVRRDGLCCKRVYEGIRNLDSQEIVNVNHKQEIAYAESAMQAKRWLLATKRWETLFTNSDLSDEHLQEIGFALIVSCRKDGRLGEARKWVEELNVKFKSNLSENKNNKFKYEKAKLIIDYFQWEKALRVMQQAHTFMKEESWLNALEFWEKINPDLSSQIYIDSVLYKIECLARVKKWKEISDNVVILENYNLSKEQLIILEGWECASNSEWDAALSAWHSINQSKSYSSLDKSKALIYLEKGDYSNYLHLLDKAGEIHKNSCQYYFETINTAVRELSQDITSFEILEPEFFEHDAYELIDSLKHYNITSKAKIVSNDVIF